jgi:hypothetical protein
MACATQYHRNALSTWGMLTRNKSLCPLALYATLHSKACGSRPTRTLTRALIPISVLCNRVELAGPEQAPEESTEFHIEASFRVRVGSDPQAHERVVADNTRGHKLLACDSIPCVDKALRRESCAKPRSLHQGEAAVVASEAKGEHVAVCDFTIIARFLLIVRHASDPSTVEAFVRLTSVDCLPLGRATFASGSQAIGCSIEPPRQVCGAKGDALSLALETPGALEELPGHGIVEPDAEAMMLVHQTILLTLGKKGKQQH